MTTTGKISLKPLNLMGYTPETQVYFVQNAGGADTATFLQAHRKHFDHSLFMGQVYYSLTAPRLPRFRAYCERKGFEVVDGQPV